jgi:hypothetical protein
MFWYCFPRARAILDLSEMVRARRPRYFRPAARRGHPPGFYADCHQDAVDAASPTKSMLNRT